MATETIDLRNLWTDGGETYRLAKRIYANWLKSFPDPGYANDCCNDAYCDGYEYGWGVGYAECKSSVINSMD